MAKLSLRGYDRDIEGLIESGHIDEAIAHCQAILKVFPMHVDTYRLLGKSLLEARRYVDAGDIFQRVLMAVPDDFVTHVGLSIIRDDEGKLDDAIWHMERAFEAQPSNPAIQSELKRLYGRRDGIEPPRIRLSRDALANMYAQGELFNQAIAEIRVVLAEDPKRPDLQVMLARAYLRSGQKVEAAEMASALLKEYEFCMDAMRILVDVMREKEGTSSTLMYKERLEMLDPYAAYAENSTFKSNLVSEDMVTLERLDDASIEKRIDLQPSWAATLGITLPGNSPFPPITDSMVNRPTEVSPSTMQRPADEVRPVTKSEINWQDIGAPAASIQTEDIPSQLDAGIAKAEIPDWLQAIAPKSQEYSSQQDQGNFDESEKKLPSWLSGVSDMNEQSPLSDDEKPVSSRELIPDWLNSNKDESSLLEDADKGNEDHKTGDPTIKGEASMKGEDEEIPSEIPLEKPVGEAKPVEIDDETFAWLESLAAKQGANQDELQSKPEDRKGEMPEWLQSLYEDQNKKETEIDKVAANEEPTSEISEGQSILTSTHEIMEDVSIDSTPDDQSMVSEPEGNFDHAATLEKPDWFDSSMDKQEEISKEQPSLENQDIVPQELVESADETSTQSGELEEIETESMTNAEEPDQGKEALPTWMSEIEKDQPISESARIDEPVEDPSITSWLNKLDSQNLTKEEKKPEEEIESLETPVPDLPEWLKEIEGHPVTQEDYHAQEPIPDWLQTQTKMDGKEEEPVQIETTPVKEVPNWVDEEVEISSDTKATSSNEWIPLEENAQRLTEIPPEQPKLTEAEVGASLEASVKPAIGKRDFISAKEKDLENLVSAQQDLKENKLSEAMDSYGKLIKKKSLLDEVIHDLQEAIYKYPVDIVVWQTLGDACMRANKLQEALDAYTKAEELLR